jgi:mRNA interferase MazF
MRAPRRGEVWLVELDPTRGHEQAGRRPALVISHDVFNEGPSDLVLVLPLTTRLRSIPVHVRVSPPQGGLHAPSAILCDGIRSISRDRLVECWGPVSPTTLREASHALKVLLAL